MRFAEGQTVVHPHHGPATVRGIRTRRVRNAESRYVILDVHHANLTVGVPLRNAGLLGLRDVLGPGPLGQLFEVLRGQPGPEEARWSRRHKEDQERLHTGDIFIIAGVVRDLARRRERRGLSHAEKDQLKEARKPVVTEIGLSLGLGAGEAEEVLEAVLRGENPAVSASA
ncbi:CarD family transcriptional regulator [Arthrobacter sp. GCM10027362]|uniref:CarD family transcriptional regulator n=1 Tax=Arthrobacter sp. GCM10027362 TaxID=3273379 RepID=UPI003632A551